jgi:hypothetical protein
MTATEAVWIKMIWRSLVKLVVTKKMRTHATATLAKSREWLNAPPLHTGEKKDVSTRKDTRARDNGLHAADFAGDAYLFPH